MALCRLVTDGSFAMPSTSLKKASFLVALLALSWPSIAFGKKKKSEPPPDDVKLEESKPKEEAKPPEEEKPADETPPADEGEKKAEAPKEAAPADEGGSKSLVEEKGKSYYTVGLRFRGLFIPSFIIHAFGDGGSNVFAPSFGPEFGIRRDNFEYLFGIQYTSYVMTHQPFKAPSD